MQSWDDILKAHEESLRTAFRVRVRLSECRHMASWHGTIEDGAVGKILPVEPNNGHPPDHTFWVWFDRPIRGRVAWSYSAAELVPITLEEMLAAP